MKSWTNLLNQEAPLASRRRGLLQLSALALLVQFFHLGLAWLALPVFVGLPAWMVWALNGFFALLWVAVGVQQFRPSTKQPLEPVRKVFLNALWLGVACLAAIFALRMGFDLGVVLFLTLGCVGYGAAFWRLWLELGKT
ncbi:hypothetical protein [Meiothermus taiwanensis]|uniref:hypothetical protein n=1 Tax=Meiothermus taiwanensis TaxID=172827 RepID=UPI00103E84A5|nr:hypothetical protein [Meiothermus taiwanensis]